MPYIPKHKRERLDTILRFLASRIEGPGELNYAVTFLLVRYILYCGGLSYGTSALARGVLKDVSDEFYRRVMHTYENKKCFSHGDVYDELLK